MNKRISSIMLSLAMTFGILAAAVPVHAEAAGNGISLSAAEVSPGEEFTAMVAVPSITELCNNVEMKVLFDNEIFEITQYDPGTLNGGELMYSLPEEANRAGSFTYTHSGTAGENTIDVSQGYVVSAVFKVKEDAPEGEYEFRIHRLMAEKADAESGLPVKLIPDGTAEAAVLKVGAKKPAADIPDGLHQESDGRWFLYQEGHLASDYTGLTLYYGTWYYVENGILNWDYTGLTLYYGTWYYVQNGSLNWEYTGLVQYGENWYYVENGILNWGYTSLVQYGENWYYVENGCLNWSHTGLVQHGENWYYVENSCLNWGYTGLAQCGEDWYYTENGCLKWGYNGLILYGGTWYYLENSWLDWGYTGLTMYYDTWYYVEHGSLNWGYTGLVQYGENWYYVENGVLNWGYTGMVQYYGTWYYAENGWLNWGYSNDAFYDANTGDTFKISGGVGTRIA